MLWPCDCLSVRLSVTSHTKSLDEIPLGSPPTAAPNAGGVDKIVFFVSLRLRRLTAENLYPSATVVRVHDGTLAEEYALSLTTLVIVEVSL